MSFYKKSDMVYRDYKWTAYPDDDPKIIGKPDSTLFSRHEGWEVLYLINALAVTMKLTQVQEGKKMEYMIHQFLPSDIRSQINVKLWIETNWPKF